MHCTDPECVNITNSPDTDAGRLLIQNGALSQDGTFPVETVLCFRPIVRIFILSVIVKLFKAIVRICEIKVYDERHTFVLRVGGGGGGGKKILTREDSAQPENCRRFGPHKRRL